MIFYIIINYFHLPIYLYEKFIGSGFSKLKCDVTALMFNIFWNLQFSDTLITTNISFSNSYYINCLILKYRALVRSQLAVAKTKWPMCGIFKSSRKKTPQLMNLNSTGRIRIQFFCRIESRSSFT